MIWPPPEDWAPNGLNVDEICRSNSRLTYVVVCVVSSDSRAVDSGGTSVAIRMVRFSSDALSADYWNRWCRSHGLRYLVSCDVKKWLNESSGDKVVIAMNSVATVMSWAVLSVPRFLPEIERFDSSEGPVL